MPFISVIVPIYNVERYVGECIASLRAQTFFDFEAICVDDGSTDGSVAAARAAAAGDARFVFLGRENGGLSAARNTGLAHATGEYVCFLDSDDLYEPHALEVLAARATADDLDLLDFAGSDFADDDGDELAFSGDFALRNPVAGVMEGQDLFVRYWDARPREYISSACLHLVRRSLIERRKLRFCEGLIHEDELFTPQLYAWAHRAAFIDARLYLYRIRPGSIITARKALVRIDALLRISQLLHAWLVQNTEDFKPAFLDAVAADIAHIQFLGFNEAKALAPADLEAYANSLSTQDRIDFDLRMRFGNLFLDEIHDDLLSSRALALGNAVVAVPRAIRDHLKGS